MNSIFDKDEHILGHMAGQLKTNLTGLKGAEEVAKAIYSTIRECCEMYGQKPDIETFMRTPAESLASGHPHGDCYVISWEAGPHDWVHTAWPVIMDTTGRLCEPYYSFDLCIYETE